MYQHRGVEAFRVVNSVDDLFKLCGFRSLYTLSQR